jgi:hypothetical protein
MLLNESFGVPQFRVGAKNRANSPGLLIEWQLCLTRIWYFVL